MRTESKKLLFDIATACRAIQGFNAGRSLGDYSADEMRRAATERMFEIIGEAVVPSRHSAIVSFTASSGCSSQEWGSNLPSRSLLGRGVRFDDVSASRMLSTGADQAQKCA